MSVSEEKLNPVEYAVYGVLCAAKLETGPSGARRMFRIQQHINFWDEDQIAAALGHLIELGWIERQPPNEFGYVYYAALEVRHGAEA